jgi:ABC-2 type transport system ATP-binding protein
MLKISNLTIRYPQITAIDEVSMELKNGTLYGLAGPNGAGKSSLIRALVGQIASYKGTIQIDDFLLRQDRQAVKSRFGYAPENPELFPYLTGREYLQMIADIRQVADEGQPAQFLEQFGMNEVKDELINSYSHGMQQKISLAAALIGEPQNLILDEALNGLDPVALFEAKNALKKLAGRGKMVLLSSHVLELLEQWCEEIIILNHGKIEAIYTAAQIEAIKKESGRAFSEHFISLIHTDSSR